jgi:hypothetical protein
MPRMTYNGIRDDFRALYLAGARPWHVGFSEGKNSTLLAAALVFDAVLTVPAKRRTKETPRCLLQTIAAPCLQADTAAELDALLPALLDRAFNGES